MNEHATGIRTKPTIFAIIAGQSVLENQNHHSSYLSYYQRAYIKPPATYKWKYSQLNNDQ